MHSVCEKRENETTEISGSLSKLSKQKRVHRSWTFGLHHSCSSSVPLYYTDYQICNAFNQFRHICACSPEFRPIAITSSQWTLHITILKSIRHSTHHSTLPGSHVSVNVHHVPNRIFVVLPSHFLWCASEIDSQRMYSSARYGGWGSSLHNTSAQGLCKMYARCSLHRI